MKIRMGYVSNSSSASFVVDLSRIANGKKMRKVRKKILSCPYRGASEEDKWDVIENGDFIEGRTWMDNFDFEDYLKGVFQGVFDFPYWEPAYDACVDFKYDG